MGAGPRIDQAEVIPSAPFVVLAAVVVTDAFPALQGSEYCAGASGQGTDRS
jgi:hypothetical protein